MAKKRVVITGMGLVSCFGSDVDHFYDQLLLGKSGIIGIDQFCCDLYPTRFAGSVRGFDTEGYVDKKQARRIDPFIQYTMVAGKKALKSGNLSEPQLHKMNKNRCGIIIGSGMGGLDLFSDGVNTVTTEGHRRITPFFIPYIITNMGGALLAVDLGFKGPNYSISAACATANFSIRAAAEHIRCGDADLMICGGVEAPITPVAVAGFAAMKALSERNDEPQKASRPWDKTRDGFVMGEGAGVLLMESLEHALERGAPIYAEYLGGSVSCDGYHITTPIQDGSGVEQCLDLALQDARVAKSEVSYINAHATSTPIGDLSEILGIKRFFKENMQNISINATKSMIGHPLGAAGGIEAIVVVSAIKRQHLHPTINVSSPEEELEGIDYLPNHSKPRQVDIGISNSFGFGGHNSILVFGRYNPDRSS